jgi:hypothetical protein
MWSFNKTGFPRISPSLDIRRSFLPLRCNLFITSYRLALASFLRRFRRPTIGPYQRLEWFAILNPNNIIYSGEMYIGYIFKRAVEQ